MPRLNAIQKSFLTAIAKKLLLFPALYYFYQAMLPLGTDFQLYMMLTLSSWLLFLLFLVGACMVEIFIDKPDIRRWFTHIDKGKQQPFTVQSEKDKKKKGKTVFY